MLVKTVRQFGFSTHPRNIPITPVSYKDIKQTFAKNFHHYIFVPQCTKKVNVGHIELHDHDNYKAIMKQHFAELKALN